jgi:hypothetical protein
LGRHRRGLGTRTTLFPDPRFSFKQSLPRSGTTLFAPFSGKRRILLAQDFLGARPQTPRVGFAEGWAAKAFCEAEQTLFASFSGKRRIPFDELVKLGVIDDHGSAKRN